MDSASPSVLHYYIGALNLQLVLDGFFLGMGMHSSWGFSFLEILVAFRVDFPTLLAHYTFDSPFSSPTSISYPFPLFLRPLVTPVNVRGDALGYVSSFPHSSSTPPRRQRLVIVAGCGINPLHLLLE